jgi:zinc protease
MNRTLQTLRYLCLSAFALTAIATTADELDIPYQQFVLPNGLTLIVHEDHKAPLVAVNMWYHVGSKNEKIGQTGFAHLFEHLMFNGSEHFNDEYFRPFEKAGATDMNGTTSNDRTNYFATVPKPALDMALWMESDRMANLLPAIDQAKLDEQRGVVKNEKRQREDRPFGKVWEQIATNTYPPGHPYSWEVIGSMQDLDAASLDQVHGWFKQYYGPNNATLVIAGDLKAQDVKQQVEKYFGSIPANQPLLHAARWIAKRSEERRDALQDRVPNARVYLVWNTPAYAERESNQLDLLADLLAGDASGLLVKQLVQKEKLATSISAYQMAREIGGQFLISADVAPGVDPLALEKRLRAELQHVQKSGFNKDGLARAKTNYRAQTLRQLEKLGGFGGKTDVLASGAVLANNPTFFKQMLSDVAATDGDTLRALAQTWLDQGVYVLHVLPYAQFQTTTATIDRSQVPAPGTAPAPNIPAVERATLDNGMQLVLMRRAGLPLVDLQLQFSFGQFVDALPATGTTNFAMQMLLESNNGLDSAAIAEKIRALGATIETYTTLDSAGIRLSALSENLDASTQFFAQLIQQPDPAADALDNLKTQTLAQIKNEQNDASSLTHRVLARLLFGDDNPYAGPLTGSGRTEVVAALTREQLQQYYRSHFNPATATLIAVGDIDMSTLQTLAKKHFGAWKNSNAIDTPPLISAATSKTPALYFIDLPGGAQATISAATVLPASQQLDLRALTLANAAFGGLFTSRLNMNLREDKHWSYGTRSSIIESRAAQIWIAAGGVQIDKTGPALQELRREWQEFISSKPITSDELEKVREQRVRQLPGGYETNTALLQAQAKNLRLQRPDNYLAEDSDKLRALDVTAVQQQSKVLNIGNAVYLVVGDKQKILPQLRALGWGNVVELDREGAPLNTGN